MSDPVDRRTFLTGVAALAAMGVAGCKASNRAKHINVGPTREETVGLSAEQSSAPTMADGRPALHLITREADGSPVDPERMKTLNARDMHNDTLPQAIVLASGRARVELNRDEPIQLSMRLKVPGFGEVYCYADNNGRGYRKPAEIDFVAECAATRLHRVLESYQALRPSIGADSKLDELTARKFTFTNPSQNYAILCEALHAGERLALLAASMRISRLPEPRREFLFGTAVAGYESLGPQYQERIRELFNFATGTWYTWKGEDAPENDRVDYARMDGSINWCIENKIVPKGFGYLYMTPGATQPWIRPVEAPFAKTQATTRATSINTLPNSEPSSITRQYNPRWSYDRIKKTYETIIRNTMWRYHPRLQYAEIMNEAHDKANLWGMSQEQILDMAKMAFRAARQGSPTVKRQMNHCCMWGEYAKRRNPDGSRRWTPFRFIRDCFDHGIDYEIIGLQLYYPQNDIFEIDRMLDRFAVFNKPLHITEIATASEDGLDPQSMRPVTYAPGWHGPWSATMQADWVEAIYTLCYSKPSFEAVGWWDLSDRPGHFWPFGGLLDKNMQPKEAYLRLKKLQKDWGVLRG